MPEFRTAPEALADAARAVAAEGRRVEQTAGPVRSCVLAVGDALPGSRAADEADRLAGTLAAETAAVATELAALAAALAAAARDYVTAESAAAGDFGRAGRWSA
jgi:hypothetical protein